MDARDVNVCYFISKSICSESRQMLLLVDSLWSLLPAHTVIVTNHSVIIEWRKVTLNFDSVSIRWLFTLRWHFKKTDLIFSSLIWKDQIPFDLCFSHCHEMNGSDSLCVEIQIHHTWACCVNVAIKTYEENHIFDLVNISLWCFLCTMPHIMTKINSKQRFLPEKKMPKRDILHIIPHDLQGLKLYKIYHSDGWTCSQPCISCSTSSSWDFNNGFYQCLEKD